MENPAIVYLYLYVALANKNFSQSKMDLILEKLKPNPSFIGLNTNDFVEDVYNNFLQLPYASVFTYLENYLSEIQLTELERTSVIHDLEEIIEADGVIKKEELLAFQRIKKHLLPDNSKLVKIRA